MSDLASRLAGQSESRAARIMSAAPGSSQTADKAPVPTSTVAEAARARYSIGHIEKIKLDSLGTHPMNRGGLGVSAFHAERVALSIISDGFSRHRYRDATVIMVPASETATFRQYNEDLAAGDSKLPPASGAAQFALLGKNHLVTALKMLRIGSFTVSGTGEAIVPPPGDAVLAAALKEGIYCDVLGEAVWSDTEAIAALLAEDNMNASVEMGTNEVEILCFMGDELANLSGTGSAKDRFEKIVVKARSRFGCTAFSDTDFLHLHNYAIRVPRALLRNLGEMHFALVPASTLRCKAVEFDLVARLDKLAPYSKVALILSVYLGGADQGTGAKRLSRVGGLAKVCSGLSPAVLKSFEEEPARLQTVELLIKTLLKHYAVRNSNIQIKKLLACRSKLYYRAGRLAQNWPETPFELKKALAAIETKYIKDMTEAGAQQGELPRKYPEPEVVATVAAKPSKNSAKASTDGKATPPVPQRLVVDVLGDDVDETPSASSGAKAVAPHDIPSQDVLGVVVQPWEDVEPLFWTRTVAEHLTHAHIMHSQSVDKVQVVKAEATEPLVWQARARVAIAPGALILVPWVQAEPVRLETGELPFKRSPLLHPALPGHEVVRAAAEGDTHENAFAVRSPLDGKVKVDAKAAAPFWCVLSAEDTSVANMAYRECRFEVAAPAVTVQGCRRNETNKAPKTKIITTFRILTNIRKIEQGQVLVALPEAKSEGAEAGSAAGAEPAAKRSRRRG